MIEKVKIKKSYPIVVDVIPIIIGLGIISLIRVLARKPGIRKSTAGAGFWGGFTIFFGSLMLIGNVSNGNLASWAFWCLSIIGIIPTLLYGMFLLSERKIGRIYVADVDKLLNILLQKKIHQKNELRKAIPTNRGGGKMLEADNIGYMLNDLQSCGVLSYFEQNGNIEVTFLMPPLTEIKKDVQQPNHWTCKSCGAENGSEISDGVCEYCGSPRK